MMKYVLVVGMLLITQFGYCQSSGGVTIIDTNVDPAGIINELPLAPPKTIGSTYIQKEWLLGNLEMINGKKVVRYPMRYDLRNKELDISYNGEVRVCRAEMIKSFSWKVIDQKDEINFINTTYLNDIKSGNPKEILNEIHNGEAVSLFKQYYLDFKESTYVPALDMGNKDNKILVKHSYYLVQNNQFFKLSMSLKKNKLIFGEKYSEVEIHAKTNKLKLKKEDDLIRLVKYYESLL